MRVHLYRMLALPSFLLGCTTGPATETFPPPCVESETLTIGSLLVEPVDDEYVRGVDLDARASDERDARGCFQEDFEDPDGSAVDNNFGTLAATIEAGLGIDGRTVFSESSLVLDVQGRGDGVCAAVSVTLDDGPRRTAEWNGTTLRAYHLGDIPLRLTFGEASGLVVLRDAAVRMTLTVGRRIATVVVSGGLDIDELTPIAAAGTDLDPRLIRTTLEGVADLEPDERDVCSRISVSLEAHPPS